jgi:hypothetical protein
MLLRLFAERRKAVVCVFVILVISILEAGQAHAQVAGATLSGTVKDTSGGTIPNAQVTIADVATGVTRNVSSDGAGLYTAPNLLPGTYEVRVTATGFSTKVQKGIALTVGAQQLLDFTMQVGQMSQTVEVTSEAPTVELTSSALSAVVTATTVRELPLNGRSWTDLASLQPGVYSAETHAAVDVNRGFGQQVTISGARPQQNNYRLDGISISDYANGGPGSILGGNLGVDAIGEFSVLTSNYSAEYGKTSGGVVNAISRSGTNQFHGSIYEFLRNSALDARNFFDPAQIPPFKRNQFGVSGGGPIRKSRTFIFGDYEGIRQSEGLTFVDQVLSKAARAGNLAAGPVPVDANVQKFLGLEPLPNGPLIGNGDRAVFSFAGQQVVSENYFTTRVDHKFSDKDSIFGTYVYDHSVLTQPDSLDNVLNQAFAKRQFAVLEESHIFKPGLINSIRFGYDRDATNGAGGIQALNPLATDPSLDAVPGRNAPVTKVPGLTLIPGGVTLPGNIYRWNAYQVYDDAFLTRGLHALKFGVAFERDQLNEITTGGGDYHGTFSFSSIANFLTNNPARLTAALPGSVTPRGMRDSIFGIYFQDDWRWRPNLTLNLGLRYEMSTVPTEVQGKLSNLYNITDATPHLGEPYYLNPTLRNFEPRLGFSWDPFRDGKTAVRGGFGIFDVLPLLYQTVTLNGRAAPFFNIGNASKLPQGSFPGGALASIGTGALELGSVERSPHRNYVQQWNFNIQRELNPNLAVMVGYVGSHGVHQAFRVDDADIVLPTLTSAGYVWPIPVGSGTVLNPNAGSIRLLNWSGSSVYDALEVGIVKKMSHGVQIQGSYTWGKSIDDNSGVLAGDSFSNSISSLSAFDLRLDRGLSDYNISRVLVINGLWQAPILKSGPPAVTWLTNGWQLGAIFKANDGVPFTPIFGSSGDPLGLNSSDPYDYPDRLSGPGCSTLTNPGNVTNYIKTQCFSIPSAPNMAFWTANCDPTPPIGPKGAPIAVPFPECFNLRGNSGRNFLIGPGLVNLDFSLFKNNLIKKISENFNAQFRMEVFNILNRANFEPPPFPAEIFDGTGAPTGSAGLLTSTTTTAREIQFALKVIW